MDAMNQILLTLQRRLSTVLTENVMDLVLEDVIDVLKNYTIITRDEVKGNGKKEVDQDNCRHNGEDFNRICLDDFLSAKRLEGKSNGTVMRYEKVLSHLLSYLEDEPLTLITAIKLRGFLALYVQRGCCNTTVDGIRKIVCSFFNWLDKEDIIGKSPARKLSVIKHDTLPEPVYTEGEVASMYEVTSDSRNRAILAFLQRTGCRVSELVNVDRKDMDLEHQRVLLHGKGGKDRVVPIDDQLKAYLLPYESSELFSCQKIDEPENFPYFLSVTTKSRLTTAGVRFVVKRAADACGVVHAHPHRFRVTKITGLLRNGMKIEDVQVIAGHASIQTTVGYNRADSEHIWKEFIRYS